MLRRILSLTLLALLTTTSSAFASETLIHYWGHFQNGQNDITIATDGTVTYLSGYQPPTTVSEPKLSASDIATVTDLLKQAQTGKVVSKTDVAMADGLTNGYVYGYLKGVQITLLVSNRKTTNSGDTAVNTSPQAQSVVNWIQHHFSGSNEIGENKFGDVNWKTAINGGMSRRPWKDQQDEGTDPKSGNGAVKGNGTINQDQQQQNQESEPHAVVEAACETEC